MNVKKSQEALFLPATSTLFSVNPGILKRYTKTSKLTALATGKAASSMPIHCTQSLWWWRLTPQLAPSNLVLVGFVCNNHFFSPSRSKLFCICVWECGVVVTGMEEGAFFFKVFLNIWPSWKQTNLFTMFPVLSPPELNITADGDELRLSLTPLPSPQCWTYNVCYKECNKSKVSVVLKFM